MERFIRSLLRVSFVLALLLASSEPLEYVAAAPQPPSGNDTHTFVDSDGDGIPDELDPDDDNDGIPDVDDSNPLVPDPPPDSPGNETTDADADSDSIPDILDPDDDNDGVSDDDTPAQSAPANPGDASSSSPGTGSSPGSPSRAFDTDDSQPLVRSLPDTGAGASEDSLPGLLLTIAGMHAVFALLLRTGGLQNKFTCIAKTG